MLLLQFDVSDLTSVIYHDDYNDTGGEPCGIGEDCWGVDGFEGGHVRLLSWIHCCELGKGNHTKMDEFLEKFQTAFDSPPHFCKINCRLFLEFMTEVLFTFAKICNINF